MIKWIVRIGAAIVAFASSWLIAKGGDALSEEIIEKRDAKSELDKLAAEGAETEETQADTEPADGNETEENG